MKDWHFWVLVAIILIQSFYLSMKIGSIEKQETELQEYARNIDQNVATVDERLVWDIIPKVEYTESTLEEMNASVDYMYKAISSVY